MTHRIAFLRAINVGGHTVKMARLIALFEELGFADVATVIASGNVLFDAAGDAASIERRIERALVTALGYEVRTFVRSPAAARAVVAHAESIAATAPAGGGVYVAFFGEAVEPATMARLVAAQGDADEFSLLGRELFWLVKGRFSDSKFSGARLEKLLGTATTVRGLGTVQRIAAMRPA